VGRTKINVLPEAKKLAGSPPFVESEDISIRCTPPIHQFNKQADLKI